MNQPVKFSDLIGQDRVLSLLKAEAKDVPRHILLYGPPGLGKTTIGRCLANEANMGFLELVAGPSLTPKIVMRKLLALSTNGYSSNGLPGRCHDRHLVLLDEAHKLKDTVQWHTILTDRTLNPDPWNGVSWLPILTVVACTNYPNQLPEPFKSRFGLNFRLEPYEEPELTKIVQRRFKLGPDMIKEIVRRSRGSARIALEHATTISRHGLVAFDSLQIDEHGLTPTDRRYLIAMEAAGRPLSLSTVSAMIQEDPAVVRAEIEPYLLRLGLIVITAKGRELVATATLQRSRGSLQFYGA
jgi:Holliday junction DNA helicase RuvB